MGSRGEPIRDDGGHNLSKIFPVLRINIYSANDKKEFQTKALKSKEVKYILKHMTVTMK